MVSVLPEEVDISVETVLEEGDIHTGITDVVCDSRAVKPGALFIAVKGVAVDSHKFIPAVIEAGAAVVVCEDMPQDIAPGITYVQVENSTIAMKKPRPQPSAVSRESP